MADARIVAWYAERMIRKSALLVSALSLSCLCLTACPGGDDDDSFPDAGLPEEAGVQADASADEQWETSRFCTKDDGAEVLGGAVAPADLVIDGDRAWFLDMSFNAGIEGKTSLWNMVVGQSAPLFVRSLDGAAFALQQHGDRLFWVRHPTAGRLESDFLGGELWSMPKSGGEPELVLQGKVRSMVVTPDALMVSRMDHIQRVSFDGSSVQDIVAIDNAWCTHLVRGSTLVWTESPGCGALWASDLQGQNKLELANLGYLAELHAIDDAYAYVSINGNDINRVPLGGGAIEAIDDRGTSWAVVGGAWLYWSDIAELTTESNVLRRVARSGGAVEDFAVERGYSYMLGADDTYAYFAEAKLQGNSSFCIKRKPH